MAAAIWATPVKVPCPFASLFPQYLIFSTLIKAGKTQRINGQIGRGIPFGETFGKKGIKPSFQTLFGFLHHFVPQKSTIGKVLIGV